MKSAYEGYSFKLSEKVSRKKVSFRNRYGITLVGDLYTPKNVEGRLSAVCGLWPVWRS